MCPAIVADMDGETYLIGKLLKFYPPQPHARTLAARYRTARYLSALRTAAIGGDRRLAGIRITLAAHSLQPLPDRSHGERGGIVRNANADPALVGGDIVNAIGRNLAKVFVLEIVDVHTLRPALGPVIAAAIPESANQLLLLGIDRYDRLTGSLRREHLAVDMLELGIAIGMVRAFIGLAVKTAASPPTPPRPDLASREKPPPPLIELGAHRIPALPNCFAVDHKNAHTAQ